MNEVKFTRGCQTYLFCNVSTYWILILVQDVHTGIGNGCSNREFLSSCVSVVVSVMCLRARCLNISDAKYSKNFGYKRDAPVHGIDYRHFGRATAIIECGL